MNGKTNGPPLGVCRLFLVTLHHVLGAAEVVAGDAVTDRPASGAVRAALDRELLRLTALLARTRCHALITQPHIRATNQVERFTPITGKNG